MSGESTSDKLDALVILTESLLEELGEAYARTPPTVSSWVNVKKAYQISLSLLRILQQLEKTDK